MRVIDFGTVKALRSQTVWHAVCRTMQPGDAPVLSFVRPAKPYVCIGYHRDIAEVDTEYCQYNGLPVMRRMVGGGPVYCDEDQLFFQITAPAKDVPARRATALASLLTPAMRALRRLGVDAELDRFTEITAGAATVCGHGAGAALLSVTAINVLRSAALPKTDFRDPAAVLAALNEAFPMERQHNMYFTIWYGVYQRSTGHLRYGSGGHPPSILCKADEVVTLSTPGLAIGMMPEMVYRTASCTISPGDRLHLVSDGTFEVETAPGEMLEFKAFVDRLSASGSGNEVLDWVRSLNGPGPLPDDFSLLTISF